MKNYAYPAYYMFERINPQVLKQCPHDTKFSKTIFANLFYFEKKKPRPHGASRNHTENIASKYITSQQVCPYIRIIHNIQNQMHAKLTD